MKREPAPTLEQVAEVIRHIDLTPLTNKLAGKQIVEVEHCLIEVLGSLTEHYGLSRQCAAEVFESAMSATTRGDFFAAYHEYQRERGQGAHYANYSPIGRYFKRFQERISTHEEKQIEAGRAVTVTHLRILAALVVRTLESMTTYYLGANDELNRRWDYWMDFDRKQRIG